MKRPVRVVLLGINSQYVHSALAPWCLAAGLAAYARAPHSVSVAEGTVNEPPESVLERLLVLRPQVLGISCYIWNIRYVEILLPLVCAAVPDCAVVLGGPEVAHRAEDALRRMPQADFLLAGEGEQPFAMLVDALCGQGNLEAVPGLCFRKGEGFHLSLPFSHPEMQPSPYVPAYFKALQGRIAYLETSRGCPYSCAFCLSGRGEAVLYAPLERVYGEILALAGSGTRTVKFVDRTFNANRKRALAILGLIAREHGKGIPPGVTFHFEVAGDLLDEETLCLIEAAPKGLFQFEIGLQSMDGAVLAGVRRKTDMVLLVGNVRRLIACGRAHVHLDLIAGLPGEGLVGFAQGFDQAYRLRPHALQLGFLKLLHGSAMRASPQDYPCEFSLNPPYQVLSTPCLGAEDIAMLRVVERALDKLHNSGRFQGTLAHLTGPASLSPFELFRDVGSAILQAEADGGTLTLDQLTCTVFEALLTRFPGQGELLRSLMLKDRLASVKTTVLPVCLKRLHARYHAVRRALDRACPRAGDAARALGFLVEDGVEQVVICDYDEQQKDPVTGLYPLRILGLSEVLGMT